VDHDEAARLRSEPLRVAAMFGRIAGRYDLMNTLMTAGLDRRWRRLTAVEAGLGPGDRGLDICCGTGDLTMELARMYRHSAVVGLDLSEPMLVCARSKARRAAVGAVDDDSRVRFVRADAHEPPFPDAAFGAVTAAFGIRNLPDLPRAFSALWRVTRPGGRFVCLEITTPPAGPGRRFHAFWFDRCVPLLGRLVAGDGAAYSYLPASVRAFPDADGLAGLLHDAGWRSIRFRRLGMGIVALHVAEKPASALAGGAAS
jgi:demethylmenaquinone methyltransferase/2-methoxy-6-polyprenyl-1,4-benzoquinol methylase